MKGIRNIEESKNLRLSFSQTSIDYYYVRPASLQATRENTAHNQIIIEDYSETILKFIDADLEKHLIFHNLKNTKELREKWESIYHLNTSQNFKYIEENDWSKNRSFLKDKQKNFSNIKVSKKLPEINKLKHEIKQKQKKIKLKKTEAKIIRFPSVSVTIKSIESDAKSDAKPFTPIELNTLRCSLNTKCIRLQQDFLNCLNLESSNNKIAKQLYFHPKTLSFTPCSNYNMRVIRK